MAKEAEVIPSNRMELEAVKEALLGNGQLAVREEDPEAVTRRIVTQILEGSADEALTPQSVHASDDVIDEPLRLLSVAWNSSDFEEGPGVFATGRCAVLLDGFVGSPGDIIKVTLGGTQILAQLYKLVSEDKLPVDIVVRKAKEKTSRGFYPKWLEYAPKG